MALWISDLQQRRSNIWISIVMVGSIIDHNASYAIFGNRFSLLSKRKIKLSWLPYIL